MKPCTCGGTNENCRYCCGSGYVPDSTPLPEGPTPRPRVPMSFIEKEPSPPVFAKERTNWKEIIGGVVALLLPFIILFLRWLWKNGLDTLLK